MIGIDEARALLGRTAEPLAPVSMPLGQALGLCLAEAPLADTDLPLVSLSAMDGYAARHGDLLSGQPLPVTLEVPAGAAPGTLAPGEAARIFTGAPVPLGADTVVQQELAEVDAEGWVKLEALKKGANIRLKGELFARNTPLAPVGSAITPARLGLLAAGGAAQVSVIPQPRLASLVTGQELVEVDQQPEPGQIRNSNGPMFRALAKNQGLEIQYEAQIGDQVNSTRVALETALKKADLILSSGGVSVGDYDFVPGVIAEMGGEILFHGVALKPGKPTLVARIGEQWFVGLPGNPLAVLTVWRLFVQPLLQVLMGERAAFEEAIPTAQLTAPYKTKGKRTVFHPALVSPSPRGAQVRALPWKGSHDLVAAAPANALLRAEPGQELAAGDAVPCYLL